MSEERTPNPYAYALAGEDPRAVLAETATRLNSIACTLTPEQLETRPGPAKWSAREVLAHIADCEVVFSFRLRQTLAGTPDGPALLQPFNQDKWAEHYSAYTVPAALALFRAAREWNLALLSTISAEDLRQPAHHPERGPLTFQIIVEMIAGHDRHHLRQLESNKFTDEIHS